MKKLDFKTNAIAAGVVIGMFACAGVVSANANTNPFSGTTATTGANSSGEIAPTAQPNTKSQVETVKSMSAGNSSTPAKELPTSNTTKTVSSDKHVQAADSTAKSTNSAVDDAQGCAVANHAQEVQVARMKAVDAGPTRVQAMENIEKNESTKGCLSSSQEILDLTLALPTIRGSWGDIGQVVRRQVDKEIAKIKDEVINRTCEIADKAIMDATAPVMQFYKDWNDTVTLINGSDAMVGKYLSDQVSLGSDKVGMYLSERLKLAETNLNEANARAAERYEGYKSDLNERVYDAIGFEIGDAEAQVDKIRKDQIQAEINGIQSRIPPKPKYTVRASGGEYYKCIGTSCEEISVLEYRDIREQHTAYNNAVEQSRTQISMLQKQMSEIGKTVAEPATTQSAPAASTVVTPTTTTTQTQKQSQAQAQTGTTAQTTQQQTPSVRQGFESAKTVINEKVEAAENKRFSISDLNPFSRAQTGSTSETNNNRF